MLISINKLDESKGSGYTEQTFTSVAEAIQHMRKLDTRFSAYLFGEGMTELSYCDAVGEYTSFFRACQKQGAVYVELYYAPMSYPSAASSLLAA